jgi:SAM-dependent methyltransferase
LISSIRGGLSTPNTEQAAREILRVLKPGGHFRVMIYHKWSFVGIMLWMRYALAVGKPFRPLSKIYADYLESPGTRAFTRKEARGLFEGARDLSLRVVLTHGDLLESGAGQRHRGRAFTLARYLWPRWLIRRIGTSYGLFLLIAGRKPMQDQTAGRHGGILGNRAADGAPPKSTSVCE